ncbi:MAG: hypothetical protein J6U54_02580 [Clostridiales bacterium]|nr:hypothetical protein [Clostridiales bacterium]
MKVRYEITWKNDKGTEFVVDTDKETVEYGGTAMITRLNDDDKTIIGIVNLTEVKTVRTRKI